MRIRPRSPLHEAAPNGAPTMSADFLTALDDVMRRAADGDLQVRMDPVGDAQEQRIADRLNHLLDVVDAFVRESGAGRCSARRRRVAPDSAPGVGAPDRTLGRRDEFPSR